MAKNFAIQKATVILEAIVNNPGTTSIADLSYQLDLPRQTVHRVIQQLDEIGLLKRDPMRQCFIPGERLRKFCNATMIHACSDTATNLVLRSEEHTSELQSLMRISYAVFCLKNKPQYTHNSPDTKT